MLFRYHNNEDAGDLRAFLDADYDAEMEMQHRCEVRATFQAEFDRDPAPCEECGKDLTRDSDAMYYERDGLFLHNENCADSYINRPIPYEGREFPTYG